MSWGDYSFSYVLTRCYQICILSQDVVLVASSGNSTIAGNLTRLHYPSGYAEVISVGNSTVNDLRASTSVYGAQRLTLLLREAAS
jgi:1-aminocyclopropane-1-carboxylate deaminase/D-cysteine desulfhydrase-like pyridoxal-dependent ACC family enzyme